MLKLITVPNKMLRKRSEPLTELNTETTQFIISLADTLVKRKNPQGVGLSAIQVGVPLRIFVTHFANTPKTKPELKIFINPEIVDRSEDLTLGPDKRNPIPEGCLSIPSLYGPVYRHQTIKIKFLTPSNLSEFSNDARSRTPLGSEDVDLKAKTIKNNLSEITEIHTDFLARIIQHEYDHLDGILFTDYIKKDGSDLYFDNGDNLIHLPKPKDIIEW